MPGLDSIIVIFNSHCAWLVRFPTLICPKFCYQNKRKIITLGVLIRRYLWYSALLTLLGSCTIIPEPLTETILSKSAKEDRTLMFEKSNQIIGSLSLEEAIARAVKYNLDHRAKAMEQALALNQLDLDDYQLLPTLTAKAGYSDRSEFSASTSQQLDGIPPSSHFSYSGDRTSFTGDLKLSWNILDFGVSYFNARQNADRSLIANERRKKVLNNLSSWG